MRKSTRAFGGWRRPFTRPGPFFVAWFGSFGASAAGASILPHPGKKRKAWEGWGKCPIWIQKPYGICPCFPYLELFALADQAEPAATPQAEGSLWLLEELGPRGGMRAFAGTAPVALIEVTDGATLVTLQRPIAQLPSSLDAHWAQEFVRHFGISHALRLAG